MTNAIKILLILVLCVLLVDIGLSLVMHGGYGLLGFGNNASHGFGCGIGSIF